jgi:hypothetical protein
MITAQRRRSRFFFLFYDSLFLPLDLADELEEDCLRLGAAEPEQHPRLDGAADGDARHRQRVDQRRRRREAQDESLQLRRRRRQ